MLIAQWYLSFRMWTRKDGRLGLQLVTILFLISMETVISTEYTIQVNHEVKIPQTMCAIVPCNFTADSRGKFKNSKGYWKARLGVKVASTDRSEVTKQNFHAFGNPDLGDCTLKITNATKEDNGSYFFRFVEKEDGTNKYNYLNDQVKVEVTDIREVDGYSIQVDQTVTVQKGLCVTIPCTFTADHMKSFTGSRGHWKTICQEFAASSDKSIVGTKPHFQLMGNPDNGDCTLKITDAKEQDSGTYHFAFEYGKDNNRKHSYISKIITIQVTGVNEIPVISDPGILTEGKKVTITCNEPNALITWKNQTGIWTNSKDLTFVPTRSHHQTSLTCKMTFPSFKSYTQKEITLYVQYPPSIIITTPEMQNHISTDRTTNQEVTVQEGSSLALKCLVDSNPEAQVTWMKGEKNVLKKGNGSEVMLYLSKIPTSGADKYHCLAENNLGAMNKTINIIVQSDNTKYFVIAGVVGIAALLLVAVTLKLLLRSRTKNTEEENKAKNHISTDNQYDCKPDDLYENTEFGSDAKKETKETEYNTEPTNLYFNFEEESVPFEEESVYANT
ncbi:sialic acid-binding Ig-like lectin 12 isoform X1 [Rana temporaria]|uniref:sialic acid-binding Ig-like lectin 12 isoform X1 n=1 Tax=Rana temporaria TaxID=8407 RepID=UPI001AAD95E0|nr:sialic acid-binding Ig-like lectin 12 isoform X1 [Rana temporaria]